MNKSILEQTIIDVAKVALLPIVGEDFDIDNKEPYELYNAIVGTVFDETGYNKVANEAPEYLYEHIPSGFKMIGEKKSYDLTGDEKVNEDDVEAIETLLDKVEEGTATYEDITAGDVTGDFKLDEHDKKAIEEEIKNQKKSEVEVEEETYTAEEAAAYNLTLDGAWQYGKVKTPAVEGQDAVLYTNEEVDAYNATLPGAKHAGDEKED